MNPISYVELIDRVVNKGVIEGVDDLNLINGTSIDIRLGPEIHIETPPWLSCPACHTRHMHTFANEMYHAKSRLEQVYCSKCNTTAPLVDWMSCVDFAAKQPLAMKTIDISKQPYKLFPGEACLASSVEVFNLPMDITMEFRLKSSQARVFLEQLHACWADPGWHGSTLTMEFVNLARYHPLLLKAGDKCGQVMFYRHEPVPEDRSYKVRGSYNNDRGATQSKGVK